jgi:N-acetyl-alpha-D-glucosaminyl L-malate synthase BshA
MKIAIVCYPTYGGSGVVATELGVSLASRGHEVHFVSYKQPVRLESLTGSVHFHEVHVPKYPLFHYQPYELALSSMLVEMVKLHQIELLHVHYAIPHAYAAYMAKQMLLEAGIDIPLVTTLHGSDITLVGNHPFYKPAVTFSINNSDVVTSVSKDLKKDTFDFFDVHKEIHVVPNFINVATYDKIRVNCERAEVAKDHEVVITHVSNFRPVKRVMDVVEVFARVRATLPAKLMMVGDGPDRMLAEARCHELGISDDVVFYGKTNKVNKILCFSDLLLLPSQTESFGLAALEGMVAATPVISSNTGGLPEVNIHGKTGFLTDVGDVIAMADHAISLLSDKEALVKMKGDAYKHACSFDVNLIVPQYEDIYALALKAKD